jgi:hypothetical protein
MKALNLLFAVFSAIKATVTQTLRTHCELVALTTRRPFGPLLWAACDGAAASEDKTTDVWIISGEPVVVETWLFTYPDGHTETVRRRHPVTDPGERAIFLEDGRGFE